MILFLTRILAVMTMTNHFASSYRKEGYSGKINPQAVSLVPTHIFVLSMCTCVRNTEVMC